MDKHPPETILAANVRWLMDTRPGLDSQAAVVERARKKGFDFDQKTVSRVLRATNPPTLKLLKGLAAAFDLETWQLVAPRLGADLYLMDADNRMVTVIEFAPPKNYLAVDVDAGVVAPDYVKRSYTPAAPVSAQEPTPRFAPVPQSPTAAPRPSPSREQQGARSGAVPKKAAKGPPR